MHLGDFMLSNPFYTKEYRHLHPIRKDVFQSMIPITTYFTNEHTFYGTETSRDCITECCYNVSRTVRFNGSIFSLKTVVFTAIRKDVVFLEMMQHYETHTLIINDENHDNAMNNEYQFNPEYHIDTTLWNIILNEAVQFQLNTGNEYFVIDDLCALIIFLKFPCLRALLANGASGFSYFYSIFHNIDFLLQSPEETRVGFTILNSQISSHGAVIFSHDMRKMADFAEITTSEYQGVVFRVKISGQFVSISCFGDAFQDIFMIFAPTNIEIASQHEHHDAKDEAKQFVDMIQLDTIITNDNYNALKDVLKQTEHLLSKPMLYELILLYHDPEEWEAIAKILWDTMNTNEINKCDLLFNIHIILKDFCCKIWMRFIDNHRFRRMNIIKLRQKCKAAKPGDIPGKTLLEYGNNNILDTIPQDIRTTDWKQYIDAYCKQYNFKNKSTKHSETIRLETFFEIMRKYEEIMNFALIEQKTQHLHDDDDLSNIQCLDDLFLSIDAQMNISQLMDAFLQIKNTQDINIEYEQCPLNYNCFIFKQYIKSRRNRLLSYDVHYIGNISLNHGITLELLDLFHLQLFHKNDDYRRLQRDRDSVGVVNIAPQYENEDLFVDALFMNHDLKPLTLYCIQEEYDSEAIYDDLYPDNDTHSNIYQHLKQTIADEINEYYTFKEYIYNYSINPRDEQAIERNLIELNFGDAITNWNVKPKYKDMTEEWKQNEFYALTNEQYNECMGKSEVMTITNYNQTTYNFSLDDILCIKVYTDFTELQNHFRRSFRTSADKNRRSQFVHWGTNVHIIFIKVEVMNEVHEYHARIQDKMLYHGLNRLFDTKKLVRQFNGLLSTTLNRTVAHQFAGDSGMILQIDKGINNRNTNALSVSWLSHHGNEEEVLLLNPSVTIRESRIFLDNVELKSSYLKSILFSTMMEDPDAFDNLSAFFQSSWIETCLEHCIKDKAFFSDRIALFSPQECFQGMNLFEFIFFKCCHYQIADYVGSYYNVMKDKIFEMIIGDNFFILSVSGDSNDYKKIKSCDRSNNWCTKYQPRKCVMKVRYQYLKDDKIERMWHIERRDAKTLLIDMSLLLKENGRNINIEKDDSMFNVFRAEYALNMFLEVSIEYKHKLNTSRRYKAHYIKKIFGIKEIDY